MFALASRRLGQPLRQSRSYAADVKAAKTGQKKKDTRDDDAGAALGPFFPAAAPAALALASRAAAPGFVAIGTAAKLNFAQRGPRLLRSLDAELCARHDADARTALFARGSPERIEPGSIVLVEQLSSRSAPRKLAFAGVLLNVKRRGILSTITVRNYVLGTGVEVVYPIYSPMVSRIKVLKPVKPGFSKGADQVNYLREKPSSAPLSFGSVEELVIRNTETERKRSQIRANQSQ